LDVVSVGVRVVSGRTRPRGSEEKKECKGLRRQDKEGLKYIKYNKSRSGKKVREQEREREGVPTSASQGCTWYRLTPD
jgi:hypothetical protein